ncbi:hypothetical protein BC940DRAFT_332908 [Gongronella butleri]|nr:hypothetical protein BC940DRAFT_332908 [Gongronella butleri]
MRNIVFAVDPFSTEAANVIEWTSANFLRVDDTVHLVVVALKDSEDADAGCIVSENMECLEHEMHSKIEAALKHLVEQLTAAGYTTIKTHLLESHNNNTCARLVQFLKGEADANCLVMGSRNLKGWKRYFMGSFSDYVQSHVDCPVLIVK